MVSLIATVLMTRMRLGPKAAALASWAIMLALALLALWLAYSWAWDRGRDHERAKWEAAAEIIEDADAIADAEALDVAHETKKDVDDANQRAADAARDSSDPLGAAFGELRKEGAGSGGKAPR